MGLDGLDQLLAAGRAGSRAEADGVLLCQGVRVVAWGVGGGVEWSGWVRAVGAQRKRTLPWQARQARPADFDNYCYSRYVGTYTPTVHTCYSREPFRLWQSLT